MPASLRQYNLKLVAAALFSIGLILAQDPTSLLTPGVMRVGDKLACRCGTCRNTVANCPMLRCHYTEPMRARVKQMQDAGRGDQEIVNTIVKEQGVVALAAPPAEGWGLFTWVMPGVALLLGFLFYSWWVRRNWQEPQAAKDIDQSLIDRFRDQIEFELGESVDQKNRNGNTGKR